MNFIGKIELIDFAERNNIPLKNLTDTVDKSLEFGDFDDAVHNLMSFFNENDLRYGYEIASSLIFTHFCNNKIGTERLLRKDTKESDISIAFGFDGYKIITLIYDEKLLNDKGNKISDIYFLNTEDTGIGETFYTSFSDLAKRFNVSDQKYDISDENKSNKGFGAVLKNDDVLKYSHVDDGSFGDSSDDSEEHILSNEEVDEIIYFNLYNFVIKNWDLVSSVARASFDNQSDNLLSGLICKEKAPRSPKL